MQIVGFPMWWLNCWNVKSDNNLNNFLLLFSALCEAGQYVKEETSNYVCEPCDVDKYQTIQHPEKGDVCVACPPTNNGVNQGTRQGGANSSDLCECKLWTYL